MKPCVSIGPWREYRSASESLTHSFTCSRHHLHLASLFVSDVNGLSFRTLLSTACDIHRLLLPIFVTQGWLRTLNSGNVAQNYAKKTTHQSVRISEMVVMRGPQTATACPGLSIFTSMPAEPHRPNIYASEKELIFFRAPQALQKQHVRSCQLKLPD